MEGNLVISVRMHEILKKQIKNKGNEHSHSRHTQQNGLGDRRGISCALEVLVKENELIE